MGVHCEVNSQEKTSCNFTTHKYEFHDTQVRIGLQVDGNIFLVIANHVERTVRRQPKVFSVFLNSFGRKKDFLIRNLLAVLFIQC